MYFYDNNSTLVKVPITQKISHRFNTHYLYRTVDGKCLKRFRVVKEPSLSLERKIQDLHLDNFYKVDEYLFNKSGDFRGIIMPFYESSQEDILLKPSDYLSDNFSTIFSSFTSLGEACIETNDANLENTIFTKDEIIIIDSERYTEHSPEKKEDIQHKNYESATWILYFSLINAAKKHSEFNGIDFYNWFYTTIPDGIELCSELAKHKHPIDYLQKVKKKIN